KIYTPLGYMPTDPTLMDIFEICEKKNIPVMTHVGGYRTKTEFTNFKVGDREYKADGSFVDTYTPVTIRDKSNIKNLLIQPMLWKRVLDKFPKLKVCFAHMGDKDEWANFRKNPQDFNNHVWQTLDLIKNPKYNAFADISYSFTVKRNVKLVKEWMKDPILSKKLLFGSDFYLTEVEKRKTKESFEHLVDQINPATEAWKKLSYENTCNYLFKKTAILD
ncbi:amidohydrolase, partial [Saprospiraceae bacterium]|nr:amidohydrolase [Saprospiraceae bacterium]